MSIVKIDTAWCGCGAGCGALGRAAGTDENVGDVAELVAGCDKLSWKPAARSLGIWLNFRGFPTIPGEDWVADFPRRDGAEYRREFV